MYKIFLRITFSLLILYISQPVFSETATVTGLYYPLVAEYKELHWDPKYAHQAYYQVYLNNIELQTFPLEEE